MKGSQKKSGRDLWILARDMSCYETVLLVCLLIVAGICNTSCETVTYPDDIDIVYEIKQPGADRFLHLLSLAHGPNYVIQQLTDVEQSPEYITSLKNVSVREDTAGVYATFTLFKFRENPEVQLRSLLDRIQDGDNEERGASWEVLDRGLDITTDAEYIYIIDNYKYTEDPVARSMILDILANFSEFWPADILQGSNDTDPIVRRTTAYNLGVLDRQNMPHEQRDVIIETLLSLTSDEDWRVRAEAVRAIEKYGLNREITDRLAEIYDNDPENSIRAIAGEILARSGPWSEVRHIIQDARIDTDPEIRNAVRTGITARCVKVFTPIFIGILVLVGFVGILKLFRIINERKKEKYVKED